MVELLQSPESDRARSWYQVERRFSFEPRPPQPDNPFLRQAESYLHQGRRQILAASKNLWRAWVPAVIIPTPEQHLS